MNVKRTTAYVTNELKEINALIEAKARELHLKERNLRDNLNDFDSLRIELYRNLELYAAEIYDAALCRMRCFSEEQDVRIKCILRKSQKVLKYQHFLKAEMSRLLKSSEDLKVISCDLKKKLASTQKQNQYLNDKLQYYEREYAALSEMYRERQHRLISFVERNEKLNECRATQISLTAQPPILCEGGIQGFTGKKESEYGSCCNKVRHPAIEFCNDDKYLDEERIKIESSGSTRSKYTNIPNSETGEKEKSKEIVPLSYPPYTTPMQKSPSQLSITQMKSVVHISGSKTIRRKDLNMSDSKTQSTVVSLSESCNILAEGENDSISITPCLTSSFDNKTFSRTTVESPHFQAKNSCNPKFLHRADCESVDIALSCNRELNKFRSPSEIPKAFTQPKTQPVSLAEALLKYSSRQNGCRKSSNSEAKLISTPLGTRPASSEYKSELQKLPLISIDKSLKESAELLKELSKRIESKKPYYIGWYKRLRAASK